MTWKWENVGEELLSVYVRTLGILSVKYQVMSTDITKYNRSHSRLSWRLFGYAVFSVEIKKTELEIMKMVNYISWDGKAPPIIYDDRGFIVHEFRTVL